MRATEQDRNGGRRRAPGRPSWLDRDAIAALDSEWRPPQWSWTERRRRNHSHRLHVLAAMQSTQTSEMDAVSTLTAAQVALVQSSFGSVAPIAETAGMMIYERIFSLAPDTRALFDDDIRPQAKRLMTAVKAAVDHLDRLDEVTPFLVKLGARHAGYGVRPEHFDVGGEALLWTLEQALGDALTPETRAAWAAAWSTIADAMMKGLRSPSNADLNLPG